MSIVGAVIYGVLLLILAMILTRQAMKRTNIKDVINEQRKQEPMRKSVTKRYLISGVVLTVSGIFLGYFLKIIVAETWSKESNPEDLTGAIVDPETPAKGTDWKYRPIFTPLLDQQTILGNAVKFMMFIYVAVICFVSVGIIGYTRSQDVGSSNAQIFEDIKKLGADKAYRKWLLRKQISKVYVLPTVIGIVITMVYQFMILWGNDGAFLDYEVKIMLIGLATSVAAVIYQYVLYRKSVMTVGKALGVH